MKKFINIFLAVLITLFAFPVNAVNVSAEGKVYDDIADGTYEIVAKAMHENGDKESGAQSFIETKAALVVENGKYELKLFVPNSDIAEVTGLQLDNQDAKIENVKDGRYFIFEFNNVSTKYNSSVQYIINDFDKENNHSLLYIIEGLDNLPKVENKPTPENPEKDNDSDKDTEKPDVPSKPDKPEYVPSEDERVVGELVSEASAEEVYELEYETDSNATSAQLQNPVKLLVKNGKQYVQIPVAERGAGFLRSLKFNGKEVTWNSTKEAPYVIQYELENGIDSEIDVSMIIDTGHMVMPHDNINIRFKTETLKMTKVKDKRVTGEMIKEEEAGSVQLYEFATDSPSTAKQLVNPVKVLEKDNKKYLQIEVNGAGFFRSLQFNGNEVVWNSITEAPNIIEYELGDELPVGKDKAIDVSMIIETPFGVMPHSDISLWLDNTVSSIELDEVVEISEKDRINIGNTGSSIKTPATINGVVKLEINKVEVKDAMDVEGNNLITAGDIFDFNFEGLNQFDGHFELSLTFDNEKFNDKEYNVAIYHFNETTKKWELVENSRAEGDKVVATVTNFSKYGVFATEKVEEESEDKNGSEPEDAKEVKYSIDYTVKHEKEDQVSTADQYFEKPGTLIEKDGKTYLQFTVNSWSMVNWLKANGKDVLIISEDKKNDTATVQLRLDGELTDVIKLSMEITVPGLYENKHNVRLILDADSKEKIVDDEKPGSGNQGGTKPTPPTPGSGGKIDSSKKPAPNKKSEKIQADKVLKINYVVKQGDNDGVSAADKFFEKPGYILEKDGKKYLQVTITGWGYIDWLKANGKDVLVISEDKKNDTAKVQIKLDGDLSDIIKLAMRITVPGVYVAEHDARLVLEPNTAEEIDSTGHYIYTGVAKPGDFGKADGDKNSQNNPTSNPKTGDTSQLMFFTLLLIGSLITLSIQIKRRLA